MQEDSSHTCLITLLSNILHFLDCRHHAMMLHNQRTKLQEKIGIWSQVNSYLLGLRSYLMSKKISLSFEQLKSEHFYTPIITGVQGSNFKKDHCIGIYKGLVFDGNIEYPLILGWDALSLCCSDEKKNENLLSFT